jgi:hypothetical protein
LVHRSQVIDRRINSVGICLSSRAAQAVQLALPPGAPIAMAFDD